MRRRRWWYWLLGITGGLALLGVGLTRLHPPPLLLNLSASVPRGLYGVRRVSTLARGMLVLVQPDKPLETLLVARGYLPAGVPLLKPVVALGGDEVCVVEEEVRVNGTVLATAVAVVDSESREMLGKSKKSNRMTRTLHLSLEPGEALLCASNCNSSFVTRTVMKKPSPISSPSTSTTNASRISG